MISRSSTPTRRIAIVGNGITRDRAPFSDESIDIYTTGSVALAVPRCTEVFDIHGAGRQSSDALNSLDCDIIWLKDDDATVKSGVAFRIDGLRERFGNIFNCSMTMILAHAIMQGPGVIELYGIDFAEGYEPEYRVTFVYLLGLARGMGIEVYVSDGSLVFGDYKTYQYDEPDARDSAVRRQLDGWRADKQRAERSAAYLSGAIDAAESCLQILGRN